MITRAANSPKHFTATIEEIELAMKAAEVVKEVTKVEAPACSRA